MEGRCGWKPIDESARKAEQISPYREMLLLSDREKSQNGNNALPTMTRVVCCDLMKGQSMMSQDQYEISVAHADPTMPKRGINSKFRITLMAAAMN